MYVAPYTLDPAAARGDRSSDPLRNKWGKEGRNSDNDVTHYVGYVIIFKIDDWGDSSNWLCCLAADIHLCPSKVSFHSVGSE